MNDTAFQEAMALREESSQKYKIMRHYHVSQISRTILTGLTLAEAKTHCKDPETSSRTCTSAAKKKITKRNGPWFEGFEKD